MKVAFIVRPNLYSIAGGDTVQIDQTARRLRELGVEVDILLSNAVFPHDKYDDDNKEGRSCKSCK